MTDRMNFHTVVGICLTALLIALPAAAQNGDEMPRSELAERVDRLARDWDVDGDGLIHDEEMTRALFAAWDTDDDRTLAREELTAGRAAWMPGDLEARFASFDVHEDGALRWAAFHQALLDAEYVALFDPNRDGIIRRAELTRGLHEALDEDGDDRIDHAEWPPS